MDTAVVDTSVVVAMLDDAAVLQRVIAIVGGGDLLAPDLINPEVLSTYREKVRIGVIEPEVAVDRLRAFASFPIDRVPTLGLVERIWDLRHNLTAYDGAFVALAEQLVCPLLSIDGRSARAPGLTIEVIDPRR